MGIYLHDASFTLGAAHSLVNVSSSLNNSIARLSTGKRLNHASDGPADLSIAANLTSRVNGYSVASKNIQQAQSMLNTADGAMQTLTGYLQQMRDIGVAYASTSDTNTQTALTAEFNNLKTAFGNVVTNTKFGSTTLLDGSASSITVQTGPDKTDNIDMSSAFNVDLSMTGLGLSTAPGGATFLADVDTALSTLTGQQAVVGVTEQQMSTTADAIATQQANFSSALSSVQDADIAAESSNLARQQILQQAAAAALAQANQQPSIALKLLG